MNQTTSPTATTQRERRKKQNQKIPQKRHLFPKRQSKQPKEQMPYDQTIEQIFAFGVETRTNNPIHFVDDETILYQAGANVVLYNLIRRTQSFFPCLPETTKIAAIAVSNNKRFLALSETGVKPCVSIWDLSQAKRVRNLSFLELSGCVIEHICFSQDCRNLLMLVGEPRYAAMLVSLELSSVRCSQAGIYDIDHPIVGLVTGSEGEFVAYGEGILKVFKVMDKSLKTLTPTLGKAAKAKFTAASYSPGGLLVGTSDGNLLHIQQGELKRSINVKDLVPLRYMMPDGVGVSHVSILNTGRDKDQDGLDQDRSTPSGLTYRSQYTKSEYVLALDGGLVTRLEISESGVFKHIHTTSAEIARPDLQDVDYNSQPSTLDLDDLAVQDRGEEERPKPNEFVLNMKCHGASVSKSERFVVVLCSTIGYCAPFVVNLCVTDESQEVGKVAFCSSFMGNDSAKSVSSSRRFGGSKIGGGITPDSSGGSQGSELMMIDQLPHSDEVRFLAFATQKSIFVSSGADRSVRAWDYLDGELVSRTQLPDTINSIDLHTSGLSLAVATGDSVKLCSLSDRVFINHEISIPNARLVRYSLGGEYLAIVGASSEISIYNVWARSLVCVLSGHSGRVTDLIWLSSGTILDRYIASVSADGCFYIWDINDGRRVREVVRKGLRLVHLVSLDKVGRSFLLLTAEGSLFLATIGELASKALAATNTRGDAGPPALSLSGSTMAAYMNSNSNSEAPPQQQPGVSQQQQEDERLIEINIPGAVPTCLCADLERGYVYCGARDGTLVILSVSTIIQQFQRAEDTSPQTVVPPGGTTRPTTGAPGRVGELSTKIVIRLHTETILDIGMSPDASVLITASKDNAVAVLGLPGGAIQHLPCVLKSSQALAGRDKEDIRRRCFTSDVLTTTHVLKSHREAIGRLRERVKEVKMTFNFRLKTQEVNSTNTINRLREEMQTLSEGKEVELAKLKTGATESEAILMRRIAALEQQHNKAVEQLEIEYQDRSVQAKEREQKLLMEIDGLKRSHADDVDKLVRSFNEKMEEARQNSDRMQAAFEAQLAGAEAQKAAAAGEFEEIRDMMEEDTDLEIQALKVQYKNNLSDLETQISGLRGENGSLRKTFVTLQKTIQEKSTKLASSEAENQRLAATIASLKHDIVNGQRDLEERDATIADRERRIFDLKKKNQDLEKFKFVLDFKIQELKKQIEPRELEVADLREQIREMDAELEKYHKVNTALEMAVSDVKLKSDALQREVLVQRDKLQERENYIKRMEFDISECSPIIQQPQILKTAVKNLLQKYAQGVETKKKIEEQTDVEIEQERHREFLERAVAQLQKKLEKTRISSKTANQKIMEENAALLKEINLLRHELHTIKQNRKREVQIPNEVQYELESLRMEVQRLKSRADHKGNASTRSTKPVSREKLPNIGKK